MTKIVLDFKSIRFKLWLYFLLIAIIILALVWTLQIFLLNNSYEKMKVSEVEEVATNIAHAYAKGDEQLSGRIQNLFVTSDLYVMMEFNGAILMFMPEQDSTIPVYKYRSQLPTLRERIAIETANAAKSEGTELLPSITHSRISVSYKFNDGFEKYNTLAYGTVVSDADGANALLYIFAPLYPVESTVDILTTQFLRVTVISILIAFLLAFFLSRRIANPIKRITQSAKKMGQGNYDVNFENGSYSEINNLASTLNTAAYELGRADNLQKDLIANVSHDLKTPLTMVKSYAEMIRDLSGDDPEKRNAHLNVIIEEADRMSALVGDMSALAQMQNTKIELNPTEFDLADATASILATYGVLEEQDGFKFTFNAPKGCTVLADEGRIKQVISNLTGNAIKYCGDNKNVDVNIRKIGKKYRLEVTDHGIGISKEDLPHVWDRYYRISSNYTRNASGSGLGLYIVKQILMLHDADFGVESEVGSGSTFWFELEAVKK